MILHKRRVLRALRGNAKRQIRKLLGIKARPKAPVLHQPLEQAVGRHVAICRLLLELMPELQTQGLSGMSVCEVGPGDCLATAALMAGLGASHVTLVEQEPPALTQKQVKILAEVQRQGLPLDLTILQGDAAPTLDSTRVSYYQKLMEDFEPESAHHLLFSNDVLEHVEDLSGFFRVSAQALKPGGRILHVIDLGGHGEFEDPLPALDFQTYSNWLYDLMYPLGHRATRRFVSEYVSAATAAGFTDVFAKPLRTLSPNEMQSVQPFLRSEARSQAPEELGVIEFALFGTNDR